MSRLWIALGFLISFLFTGCASTPLDHYLETPYSVPDKAKIENVPYIAQTQNHCGPATMAMVMNWAGKNVSPDDLSEEIYTPREEGSFQMDMIGAARREGLMATLVNGYDGLFKEVAEGNPVLVFENLGVSWYPFWHYAVVIGYDLPKRKITLHSGDDPNSEIKLRNFESDWSRGDYWALVVLPPTTLSATADEVDELKAASGIERVGLVVDAETAYQTILKRWPHSLGALIGIGNIEYSKNNFKEAVLALKQAAKYHADNPAVWHNLAIAYSSLEEKKLAKTSARKALALIGDKDSSNYLEDLKPILAAE